MRGRSLRDAMLHEKLMRDDYRRLTAIKTRLPPTSDEWPARAMHAPGDFPVGALDVRGHAVLRYRFDTSVGGIPTAEPETRPETASERSGSKRRKADPMGRGEKPSSSASGSGSGAEGLRAQYLY